jgi:hypothetical protein
MVIGRSIDRVVVTDHHVAIESRVDIEFDGGRPDGQGVFNREECRRRPFEGSALMREGDHAPFEPGIHVVGSP